MVFYEHVAMTSWTGSDDEDAPFVKGEETVCVVCTLGSSLSYSVAQVYGICSNCMLHKTVCIKCGDPSYMGKLCRYCDMMMDVEDDEDIDEDTDVDTEFHFSYGHQPEEYDESI